MGANRSSVQLGRRLRRFRTSRGLTQAELAEPQYTHAYVSTIEAGRRYPSDEALRHFARRLGVDVGELATGRPPDLAAQLELRIQEARSLISRGDGAESRSILEQVNRDARRYDLKRIEAMSLATLAACSEHEGDPEGAIALYEKAEETLANEAVVLKAYAIAGQARCHHVLGDVRYAIHLCESFLDDLARQQLHDPDAMVRVYSPLILAYFDVGLFQKADATAKEALRLSRTVDDPSNIAAMHVNVARLLLQQGKHQQAERSLQRAQDLYGNLQYPIEAGVAHLARGYALIRSGQLDKAEPYLDHARRLLHETRSKINEAHALNELGRLYRLLGRARDAEQYLKRAIRLLDDASDVGALAWAHRELGLCLATVDPLTAEKSYRRAIRLFERAGEMMELAGTFRLLGDLLHSRGEATAACDAYREGVSRIPADC
jgi:tetratricopeptide (TPR) repeat protein